jgi:hypothetical protein
MPSAIVKLHALCANGEEPLQTCFAVLDDEKILAEVIEEAASRIGVDIQPCQLTMYVQRRGHPDTQSSVRSLDDLVKMDHEYTFTDKRLQGSLTPSTSAAAHDVSATPASDLPASTTTLSVPNTLISSVAVSSSVCATPN